MGCGLRASAEAVQAMVPHEVFLAVQLAGPVAAWALVDADARLVNWGLVVTDIRASEADRFRHVSAKLAELYPALQRLGVGLPAGHQIAVGFAGPGGALGGLGDLMRTDETLSFLAASGCRLKALRAVAAELCAELLEVSGSTHLVVATDGSVRRGRRGAGAGWVSSWGDYGCLPVDTSSILVAEVAAIAHALSNAPSGATHVTVRSDSTCAIAIAVQALRFGATAGPLRVPAKAHTSAVRIHTAGQRLQVRLEWVRAHAGDPMNETADRLAVLARRSHHADVDPAVVAETAAAIAGEHLATLSSQPAAVAA